MPEPTKQTRPRPGLWTANAPHARCYEHIVATLITNLAPLSDADKTRVLLALHYHVGDMLDALSTSTHD